jgi:hypothetical protein
MTMIRDNNSFVKSIVLSDEATFQIDTIVDSDLTLILIE